MLFDLGEEEETPAAARALTMIKVRVKNPTAAPVDYIGLSGVGDLPCAWVAGDPGKKWIAEEYGSDVVPDAVGKKSISPGDEIADAAVFAADVYDSRILKLYISGLALGQERAAEILIAP